MKVYHYTHKPFESFDLSKCDGFWFTDISPKDEGALKEIGASSLGFVAVCELSFNNPLVGGDNYDVEEQLLGSEYDAIENRYDGFTDYAVIDPSKIKVIEWLELA